MTFVALVTISMTASAQSVYVSTGDGAVAYHKSKSCSYLANSKDVKAVSTAEAKKMGRHECSRCYGTNAAAAKKTTTKAVKKTEGPARDEKGRFIKKADTEKKATTKKADTKKATTKKADTKKAAEKKTTTTAKKSTPARDEKGRFGQQLRRLPQLLRSQPLHAMKRDASSRKPTQKRKLQPRKPRRLHNTYLYI